MDLPHAPGSGTGCAGGLSHRWHGAVLPEDKASHMKRLQAEGRTVAMESAGVTLVKGDLRGIERAGHPAGCRCPLSGLQFAAFADVRRSRHGNELCVGCHQRATA